MPVHASLRGVGGCVFLPLHRFSWRVELDGVEEEVKLVSTSVDGGGLQRG